MNHPLPPPDQCCGCGVCADACPAGCISLPADAEGFRHPEIDTSRCRECGACGAVCPVDIRTAPAGRLPEPEVYAAFNNDEAVRLDSTSGGLFSALAERIFADGGMVGGAVFRADGSVRHILTGERERLPQLRSSKYLQSDADGFYCAVKQALDSGSRVLVCGTPCQIAGLYNFLRGAPEKLITCDFVCLGVNSPMVFLRYLDFLRSRHGELSKIKFKDKTFGWHRFSLRLEFANGQVQCLDRNHDPFFIGFLRNRNFIRPSCYRCAFRQVPHLADLTLGDFWGIEKIEPGMDQDRGTSLVMANTAKGRELFRELADSGRITCSRRKLDELFAGNAALTTSPQPLRSRRKFFHDLDTLPFEEVIARHLSPLSAAHRAREVFLRLLLLSWRVFRADPRHPLSLVFNTLRFNFFCRRIHRGRGGMLLVLKNTRLHLAPESRLSLEAPLQLGERQHPGSGLETRILLEKNAILEVTGGSSVSVGSFIRVVSGGKLTLAGCFINENVQITCAAKITIGRGTVVGRDVIIRDYDGHSLLVPGFNISREVVVGPGVWIGNRATILKGVNIGTGAVVAAEAVVTRDVPPFCVVAGNPARVIRENVVWKN